MADPPVDSLCTGGRSDKEKIMGTITVGHENSTPVELYYEDQGRGRPVVLRGPS
jgi:hypothetical protein